MLVRPCGERIVDEALAMNERGFDLELNLESYKRIDWKIYLITRYGDRSV